ncbi:hypothetical protein CRG98_006760 [Punica granatum]|uniref:Uncharacterized protein n=1 Tax=Punica granatum TaxID=22663 RepID=A0A2I0KWI4_PUNGR|nr:hypothetical protein CRG98_006760 [Punica granatum]
MVWRLTCGCGESFELAATRESRDFGLQRKLGLWCGGYGVRPGGGVARQDNAQSCVGRSKWGAASPIRPAPRAGYITKYTPKTYQTLGCVTSFWLTFARPIVPLVSPTLSDQGLQKTVHNEARYYLAAI